MKSLNIRLGSFIFVPPHVPWVSRRVDPLPSVPAIPTAGCQHHLLSGVIKGAAEGAAAPDGPPENRKCAGRVRDPVSERRGVLSLEMAGIVIES